MIALVVRGRPMFPILEIESAYLDHWSPDWAPTGTEFEQVGALCEQWLLSFTTKDPSVDAIGALCTRSRKDFDKRMYFAMSMALCNPSPETGLLLDRYRKFIAANGHDIGTNVSALSNLNEKHSPIDLMSIFRNIPADLYEVATKGYRIALGDLRHNAVAWDDLDVFTKSLDSLPSRGLHQSYIALSSFPIDPNSKIHQAVMTTPDAQASLLLYQLEAMRGQLTDFSSFTNGVSYERCTDDMGITLKPGKGLLLNRINIEATTAPHHRPDFAALVMKDPAGHIKQFFEPIGQRTLSEVNQEAATGVTEAFLRAGIDPIKIITHGPCKLNAGISPVSLHEALNKLVYLEENDLSLYHAAYKAFLGQFTASEIIEQCSTAANARSAYLVTGNKALLQEGSDQVRSLVMGADLGL
ncbi:hypothetical protein IFT48_04050 [Pseudomonas fluorescens]|uniref:hypothetical protein n=1 Tax=Pseudomonas fluorescens TaxID=294 RepID=UPI001930B8EB|nr:hypothetical protein [Pseudomonas fluorescens]MBD8089144.1 hypothetical protein [Pseudomonas fluorescens]